MWSTRRSPRVFGVFLKFRAGRGLCDWKRGAEIDARKRANKGIFGNEGSNLLDRLSHEMRGEGVNHVKRKEEELQGVIKKMNATGEKSEFDKLRLSALRINEDLRIQKEMSGLPNDDFWKIPTWKKI